MYNSIRAAILAVCMTMFSVPVFATFGATIPVIDMHDFKSKTRHHIFIEQLSAALKSVGFVAIINSGVDSKVLDEAYAAAADFYAEPLEVKMASNAMQFNGQRGYVLSETAKGNAAKDFKEFYHIGRDHSDAVIAKYNYAPNIWPANPAFKNNIKKLIRALDKHLLLIEQALSESIGENPQFFSNMTRDGDFLLRSIHYPANPPANSIWAAAHTDIDLFTILPRSTAEGLQVLNSDGKWINVRVPDNAIILNAGDMLQNITNGVYKSCTHRVMNNTKGEERFSMVAFVHVRPTDNVGPLAKFIQQVGERKFADATQKELLSERLVDLGLNSSELLEQLASSGVMDRLVDVNRASPTAMRALKAANLASPKVLAALGN